MLRNIAGIMADEEIIEISSSGLYNSSLINSTYNEYSDYLLESLSEFTIMAWVRFDAGGGTNKMTIYGGLYDNLGSPSTGSFSFEGDNGSDRIDFSIKSSASTTLNVFAINTNLTGDTWYHLCVTGSVLDNELKLFLDGQLIKTSTMPYSTGIPWNATSAKSYSQGSVPFYMAQFNVFERRLTEVEVLENYVYDDDTMSSGALGWDAMTPTQKVDLIYSSSFIQNISSSGNEFNDKTGNLTSVTPKPSLTGDQIYIYTDASDLPSATEVFNISSRSGFQGYQMPTGITISAPALTFECMLEIYPTTGSFATLFNCGNFQVDALPAGVRVSIFTDLGTITSSIITFDELGHFAFTCTNDGNLKLFKNGTLVDTVSMAGRTINTNANPNTIRFVCANSSSSLFYQFHGECGLIGITYTAIADNEIADLFVDADTGKCLNSKPQVYKDNAFAFWNLGNWGAINVGDEMVNQADAGTNDLTIKRNASSYIDAGSKISC